MNAVPQLSVPAVDLTDPAVFGHLTSETLRFADVDANDHINNVAYLVLFENARVTYIARHLRFMRERGLSTVDDVRRTLERLAASPTAVSA